MATAPELAQSDAATRYCLQSSWVAFVLNEAVIRFSAFSTVLVMMALWESAAPRRIRSASRTKRWPNNLGVVVLNTFAERIVFPITAVGFALVAEMRGWGLFNEITVPRWFAIALSVALLDLVIYLQHVMFHALPLLWRVHRMHHADLDFDFTTGVRFHPVEILLSMVVKLSAVSALGPPAVAVLTFEVLLNASSMFNHSNVLIPTQMDRMLRLLVVTPDMHRVHHSVVVEETNSNFGFNLSCWDRALGTYRAQPTAGHEAMTIGIEQFRDPKELRLDRMLAQPFRGQVGGYPINRAAA